MILSKIVQARLFCVITTLTLLTSCTKNLKYPNIRLVRLKKTNTIYSSTRNDVVVSAHLFSTNDNIKYFNRATTKMHTIQLSLGNQSAQTWVLLLKNVDLPLLTPTQAARNLQDSLLKSGAIFIIPLQLLGFIAASIHGIFSYNANKLIANDIKNKILEDELMLYPGECHNLLLYVHKSCELEPFSIVLYNAENKAQKITYRVVL